MNNDNFFEYLQSKIANCVKEINANDMYKCKCVLVFGSNLYQIIQNYIIELKKHSENVKVILVAQPQMCKPLKDILSEEDIIIEWNDKYSIEILNELENFVDLTQIDNIVYYTQSPIDLSDLNILEIADRIKSKSNDLKVYSFDRSMSAYGYCNLKFYIRGLKLYNEINEFIDEALDIQN